MFLCINIYIYTRATFLNVKFKIPHDTLDLIYTMKKQCCDTVLGKHRYTLFKNVCEYKCHFCDYIKQNNRPILNRSFIF